MNPRPLRASRAHDVPQTTVLDAALQRGIEALLAQQDPKGFWVHELEADATITSEYLLLRRWMGNADTAREAKAARHLLSLQLPDGGWPISMMVVWMNPSAMTSPRTPPMVIRSPTLNVLPRRITK